MRRELLPAHGVVAPSTFLFDAEVVAGPFMSRSLLRVGLLSAVALVRLVVGGSVARADERLPEASGATKHSAATPTVIQPRKSDQATSVKADATAKDSKKDASPEEHVPRGVVVVERAGQALALGAALSGDGRILTALSPLASGNDLDVRFADGTVVRVKLGHHDRIWDLALLVPQAGKWSEGLLASSRDPVRPDAAIRAFSLGRNKVLATPIVLRARRTLLGGDDKPIENAIEIGSRVSPTYLGSPLLDEDGRVVAVLGRGCAPNDNRPCTPVAFGIPVAAIRTFLQTVPP